MPPPYRACHGALRAPANCCYFSPASSSDALNIPPPPFVQGIIRLESFFVVVVPSSFCFTCSYIFVAVRFAYVPNYTDYNAGIGDVALIADVVSRTFDALWQGAVLFVPSGLVAGGSCLRHCAPPPVGASRATRRLLSISLFDGVPFHPYV